MCIRNREKCAARASGQVASFFYCETVGVLERGGLPMRLHASAFPMRFRNPGPELAKQREAEHGQ